MAEWATIRDHRRERINSKEKVSRCFSGEHN